MSAAGDQRCGSCGARNPGRAEWCSQCFGKLAEAAPDPAAAPGPAPTPGPASAPAPPALPPAPNPEALLPLPGEQPSGPPSQPPPSSTAPPAARALGDGRFRETAEGLEWSCAVCDEWNPLERVTCVVCGTSFGATIGDDTQEPVPDVAAGLLIAASALLPGAGHALLHQWGQAATRAILSSVWGVGGLLLLFSARSSGQPALPAIPLLVGWLLMLGASINDALVVGGAKGQLLLTGRRLLYLVIGVLGGTFALAFLGAMSALGG